MLPTTFTWTAFEEALGAALAAYLPAGVVVQWAEQDVPVRTLPRAELQWVSLPRIGLPEVRHPQGGADGEYLALEQIQASLQVDVFAESSRGSAGAMGLADEFAANLVLEAATDALAALGVAVIDISAPRNVGALVGAKIEGRAVVELQLGLAKGQSQQLSWVNSAETTGTYSGG